MTPVTPNTLDHHVINRIAERLNLGHLYDLETDEHGVDIIITPAAAASVWRVVQDAIAEAGWRVVPEA